MDEFFRAYGQRDAVPSVEEYLAEHPTASLASAEEVVARMAKLMDERLTGRILALPAVDSREAFARLTPPEFLERWLELNDYRYEIVKRLRSRGDPVPTYLTEAPAWLEYDVVRTEMLGADQVRVSYRTRIRDSNVKRFGAVASETAQRCGDGAWRLVVHSRLLCLPDGYAATIPEELMYLFQDEIGGK